MENSKSRKINKSKIRQAFLWGAFLFVISLVIFLLPGSQIPQANSENNFPTTDASFTQGNKTTSPYLMSSQFESEKEIDDEADEAGAEDDEEMTAEVITVTTNPEDNIDKPDASSENQANKPKDVMVFSGNFHAGKKVALTFDDGPYPIWTGEYIKVLTDYQVPAAFFVVANRAEKYAEITQKIIHNGFELGSHSYRHAQLTSLKPAALVEDFHKAASILNKNTQIAYFRPPYGDYNQAVMEICLEYGMQMVGWNVDPRDWDLNSGEKISQRVLSNVKDGAIILLHEGRAGTLEALPSIIEGLQNMGYQLVSLGELMN